MALEIEKELIRFPDGSARAFRDFIADQPAHAVVELAPGRYAGPLTISRPLTLRGAGELTRIFSEGRGPVITVTVPREGRASLDSIRLEDGAGARGGGVSLVEGRLRMHNVHVERCRAVEGAGGAIAVFGGELDASLFRAFDVSADRGGAIWIGGRSVVKLRDVLLRRVEARLGGALAIEDSAQVFLEGVTIGRARATTTGGGQAIYVAGRPEGDAPPALRMRRVRLEDAPFGLPLVIERGLGEVSLIECDVPRVVLSAKGVIDGGANRWR